jgi:hypothetical protein
MAIATWLAAFGIIIKIMPLLVDMMKEAKKLFDEIPDSGEQKKQYVMSMVHVAAIGLCEFTGDEMDKVIMTVTAAMSSAIEFLYKLIFDDDDIAVEEPK